MGKLNPKSYVFDVCGTLYASNTTYDFLLFYFKKSRLWKYITCRLALSFPSKALLVVVGKLGGKIGLRSYLVGLLADEPVGRVKGSAIRFVNEFLTSKKIHYTHNLLQESIKNGDRIILASGSLFPVVQAIADVLNVDEFIASTLEQDKNGKYTGLYLLDVKARKMDFLDLKNSDMVVVTDNRDDLSLIRNAGEVLIVSKRKNIAGWKKVLKKHTDYRFIEV